jgi:hypothetical protein
MTATAQTPVKLVTIRVDNSRIMDRHETAHITLQSPTGRTIELHKWKLAHADVAAVKVFQKCCGDPMVRFIGDVELTIEEMRIAHRLAHTTNFI